jgi:glycosyltransferase involved in cell wall biosynthesis
MKVLFVHNNFPAQFKNLAGVISQLSGVNVAAIGSQTARATDRVTLHRYRIEPAELSNTHPFARRFDLECRRAEQVLYASIALAKSGFSPNTVVAHGGWGEALPLRHAFPRARIINYCEYYYQAQGADIGFDPEFPEPGIDGLVGLQLKNATTLLSVAESDDCITPTQWQRSTFPVDLHAKIKVLHEGIDTTFARPDPDASYKLNDGTKLTINDEVLTFVARNLEPLRGYHIFMRALPQILESRPNAHVIIIGGDGVSYGQAPPGETSWKTMYLDEVKDRIDRRRVHFEGQVSHDQYVRALQVSSAHVYLTYPFVLSWSLLEALSVGCVVIASATGPVEEVIDGSNGILVPFFDCDLIADRVISALKYPQNYAAKRLAARASVEARYSLDKCLPPLVDFVMG